MSDNNSKQNKKITSIGGSALIEGIMMRGPKRTTVAVRINEQEIYTEDIEFKKISERFAIFKWPFLRGISGLIESLRLSYKALMISADKALGGAMAETDTEPQSKFEKWITEKFGDKLMNFIMVIAAVFGVIISIGLFFFLPTYLFDLAGMVVKPFQGTEYSAVLYKSVFEGILKIILFLGYIVICSQIQDMKRVFMYHGAEHKTIFCYESDEDLTVENVKHHTRFHPRCGTSFMIYMLLLGIIIGLFIPVAPFGVSGLRPVIKILLLPVSCGIGYEVLKLCGKFDNKLTRIIAAPGIWAQHITTKEPDDSMIEIAITAMKAVIPEDGTDILK